MNAVLEKIRSSIDHNDRPKNLKIFEFTKIINPEYVYSGDNVIIDDFCLVNAKEESPITIGSWVHIASFTSITGGPVKIGNFVSIASGTRILGGTEGYQNGVLVNPTIPDKYRDVNRDGCIFEDFCFVGVNCVVFPGVTLGEGAIVNAGSIIRESLEPWGVYFMKNGRMVKWIKSRDKELTYQTANKVLKKNKDVRILKDNRYY